MQKNVFLSAAKIKKLIDEYEQVKIREIIIHRFPKEKGYKWKGPLNRVKNEQEQKSARLAFSKKLNRNWKNVFYSDESSFYLRSRGISRWVSSNDRNYVKKSKYSKKVHSWVAFWRNGAVKLQFFDENMNSKEYTDMLEKSLTMMNELLPNEWILQWDNDSKHKSIKTLRFYVKKKIKLICGLCTVLTWIPLKLFEEHKEILRC